jgi:hypothetical protein
VGVVSGTLSAVIGLPVLGAAIGAFIARQVFAPTKNKSKK